jgi:hypothetical protein
MEFTEDNAKRESVVGFGVQKKMIMLTTHGIRQKFVCQQEVANVLKTRYHNNPLKKPGRNADFWSSQLLLDLKKKKISSYHSQYDWQDSKDYYFSQHDELCITLRTDEVYVVNYSTEKFTAVNIYTNNHPAEERQKEENIFIPFIFHKYSARAEGGQIRDFYSFWN